MDFSGKKGFKEALKGYFIHLLVFMAIFVPFMVGSRMNFKPGLLIIFLILLLFIKRIKSIYYLFLISLPFTNPVWSYNSWFNVKITYVFFILLVISFIYPKIKDRDYSFAITPIDLPLFIFIIVATVSVFQSAYIGSTPFIIYDSFRSFPWIKGFLGVLFLLAMYAVYYVTSSILKDKGAFKETLFITIINAVVVSLYGLVGYLNMLLTSRQLPSLIDPLMHYLNTGLRIKSVASEPFFIGSFIITVLPLAYCLLVQKKEYFSRKFLIFSCVVLTLTLLLTLSRGVWLGFLVFAVMFAYWTKPFYWARIYKPAIRILLKISFFVMLLMIVLIGINPLISVIVKEKINNATYVLTEPIMSIFDHSYGRFWSTKVRLWAFEYAWEGFKKHPVLGVGYSNYGFYSGNKVYKGLYLTAINFPEVNNFPLRVLSETGLIGFAVMLWLFAIIIGKLLKRIRSADHENGRCLATGYFFAFVIFCTLLLFSSYINHLYIWVFMAMMMNVIGTRTIILKKDENDNR